MIAGGRWTKTWGPKNLGSKKDLCKIWGPKKKNQNLGSTKNLCTENIRERRVEGLGGIDASKVRIRAIDKLTRCVRGTYPSTLA